MKNVAMMGFYWWTSPQKIFTKPHSIVGTQKNRLWFVETMERDGKGAPLPETNMTGHSPLQLDVLRKMLFFKPFGAFQTYFQWLYTLEV